MTDRIIDHTDRHFHFDLFRAGLPGQEGRMEEARRAIGEARKIAPDFRACHLRFMNLARDDKPVGADGRDPPGGRAAGLAAFGWREPALPLGPRRLMLRGGRHSG